MSGRKGQRSEKPADVPDVFAPGFLLGMDARKSLPRAVSQTITELADAIGGDPSPQMRLLIEHGVWTHMRLRQLQAQFLASGEFNYREHSALTNALVGCLRSIGLTRVARKVDASEYLKRFEKREAAAVGD